MAQTEAGRINPLTEAFDLPPFDRLQTADFQPGIKELIARARSEVQAILDQESAADFHNTVEPLEALWHPLNRATSMLFNLHSAETSEELEKVVEQMAPELSAFSNDLLLNHELFSRVQKVWEDRTKEQLGPQELRLLEKTYRSFRRNGALLTDEEKEKLRSIDEQLSIESIQFGQVVLKDTNDFFLHLSDQQLDGLPTSALENAKEEARSRGLEDGGVITLQAPSYGPAMSHLKDRSIRRELHLAFGSRGLQGEDNNRERVFRIAQLRKQRAEILGYASHAAFILEERMARSPQRVLDFLKELQTHAQASAERDLEELRERAEKDGITDLAPWDLAFYSEAGKKERFDLDTERIRPYFPLEAVLQGAFEVAQRLYGLQFKKNASVPVYHKDVDVYEVLDDSGRHLSLLYTDFYPRKGKRAGAWMTSFRDQHIVEGKEQRPQISIVCNFTPPSSKRPALLDFREVTTLFHEFGHALHGMLAEGSYASLNGTHVDWDFVELPSQIMENWCYETECLKLFARHYERHEDIPEEEIDRIRKAANYMEGLQTFRQLGFGFLDMAWHHELEEDGSLEQFEQQALQGTQLLERPQNTALSTAFSHIFQGGYSAGYYSYKWAEVLDADAFELFREKGLFDPATARAFRKLLSSGGQVDPETLYRNFRGRDAKPEALLKRAGLIES